MKKEFNNDSKKVVNDIFTAEPFQSAMQEIVKAVELLDEAQRNPRDFFKRFGVDLPKDCDIEVVVKEVKAKGKVKRAVPGSKIICVSWCTRNNCYTYCAVIQHYA